MPSAECGWLSIPGGAAGSLLLCQYGPTISVDIGFDPTYRPGLSTGLPVAGIRGIPALLDTGAMTSCIDSLLAAQLNLPIFDRTTISGVGGPQQVNLHLAQVHIPSLGCTEIGMFAGVHLAAGGQPHQALLGRTRLQAHTMVYEGPTGKVTISRPDTPLPTPQPPTVPPEPTPPAMPPAPAPTQPPQAPQPPAPTS